MNGDPKNMTCEEFQSQLADLVGSGADVSQHPHLQTCDNCRALLADLQTIADAAKQLFPIEQPEEDLWDRIELAINGTKTQSNQTDTGGRINPPVRSHVCGLILLVSKPIKRMAAGFEIPLEIARFRST